MTEQMISRFITARGHYIAKQFQNLNDRQLEAVLTTEGPLLVLAGAGSGKTTALIHRIANLVRFGRASDTNEIPADITDADVTFLETLSETPDEDEIRYADQLCAVEPAMPWSILAITFTNKAAGELRERLASTLGSRAEDVWAMTFHSACCRILRSHADRLGYARSFTIYDASDSERLMRGIIKDMELDDKTFPAKYVLGTISRYKDKMLSPEDMNEDAEKRNDWQLHHIARAYTKYQTQLKENNALDFDDIIFQTVLLLQSCEDVRTFYQRKFRYILVDEYQDTNHMQHRLTSLLAGGYENICVVGDDDQSIYRFRGASIENILNFEHQYRSARTVRLEQNYRSTQSILQAANAVIVNNLGRKGKKLWTSNTSGDPITVYEASDEAAEANYVTDQIIAKSGGQNFRDFAILYRTNAQANALEFSLKRNAIPYRVIGGTRFFDRAEIKDMLSYLCVINNRKDDLRLMRIVNNPPRGLGAKTLDVVERIAEAEGQGIYHVISDPYSYGPLEKSAEKLMRFTVMIEELAQLLESGISLTDFYEQVLDKTGYEAMLALKPTEENKTRLENVRELKSSISSYIQNTEEPTLAGFLEEISLYTDLEQYNESDDTVVLMTIHSSKGLEFSNVFLVGMEDGLFPGMPAIGNPDEMEEERRLCYVAITRAKKTLTMSYARQRMLYGHTSASLPSRFLKEIPESVIQRKGGYYVPYQEPSYAATRFSYAQPKNVVSAAATTVTAAPTAYIELNKGDMVEHRAFGKGMVLSVRKMGGDALLEIAFDDVGTKKLMAKTASQHMRRRY